MPNGFEILIKEYTEFIEMNKKMQEKKSCWFKRIRCKHENQVCITNIRGDLRNIYNCMSVWKCKDCGKVFYKDVWKKFLKHIKIR